MSTTFLKQKDINGVILHFSLKKPWDSNHLFHNEWINSLKRADKIDIQNPPLAQKMSEEKISEYEKFVKKARKNGLIKGFFYDAYISYDRFLGIVGLFLKRFWPDSYYFLKKYI